MVATTMASPCGINAETSSLNDSKITFDACKNWIAGNAKNTHNKWFSMTSAHRTMSTASKPTPITPTRTTKRSTPTTTRHDWPPSNSSSIIAPRQHLRTQAKRMLAHSTTPVTDQRHRPRRRHGNTSSRRPMERPDCGPTADTATTTTATMPLARPDYALIACTLLPKHREPRDCRHTATTRKRQEQPGSAADRGKGGGMAAIMDNNNTTITIVKPKVRPVCDPTGIIHSTVKLRERPDSEPRPRQRRRCPSMTARMYRRTCMEAARVLRAVMGNPTLTGLPRCKARFPMLGAIENRGCRCTR
eukprot:m.39480 g.39480  ORF g.39480 m.39480 type:complete len:303 (+) comp5814_c0_seq1:658-1566(+)